MTMVLVTACPSQPGVLIGRLPLINMVFGSVSYLLQFFVPVHVPLLKPRAGPCPRAAPRAACRLLSTVHTPASVWSCLLVFQHQTRGGVFIHLHCPLFLAYCIDRVRASNLSAGASACPLPLLFHVSIFLWLPDTLRSRHVWYRQLSSPITSPDVFCRTSCLRLGGGLFDSNTNRRTEQPEFCSPLQSLLLPCAALLRCGALSPTRSVQRVNSLRLTVATNCSRPTPTNLLLPVLPLSGTALQSPSLV